MASKTRFSDWFTKVVGSQLSEHISNANKPNIAEINKEIEEQLPSKKNTTYESVVKELEKEHKTEGHDYAGYMKYYEQKRAAHIRKAKEQVNDFDSFKKEKYSDYQRYGEYEEVDDKDKDEVLDKALDLELQKKLDSAPEQNEDISDERKKMIEANRQKLLEKMDERNKVKELVKQKIMSHDSVQKENREDYVSFDKHCEENDIPENNYINKEMDIILMEKLGVYKEEDEDEAIKQARAERSKYASKSLNTRREVRNQNIGRVMHTITSYDKSNYERPNNKFGVEDDNDYVKSLY